MADDANTQTAVTDDQELAKVLATMSDEERKQADETQAPAPVADVPAAPTTPEAPGGLVSATDPLMVAPPPTETNTTPAPTPVTPSESVATPPGDLGEIKRLALNELRPIVDQLELPAEEKFDALLLVIRSSDDQSLVKTAYTAAEGITDPAKKAQALLDIVKEIEYFSQQAPAA